MIKVIIKKIIKILKILYINKTHIIMINSARYCMKKYLN